MKQYYKMKESGIQQIGKVPEHWSIEPLKYNIVINGKVLPETTEPDNEMLYIDISSVNTDGSIREPQQLTFGNAPSRARRIITSDDSIISTVRTYLKAIAYFPNPAKNLICSTGFAVLSPLYKLFPKYLFYWISSSYFIDEIGARSVGVSYPAINSSEIGKLPCLFPPLQEQKTICKYLRLGHNYYSIFITNKASLLVYDVLVKQYTDQQTSREEISIYSN